jgi:hypothetical protein
MKFLKTKLDFEDVELLLLRRLADDGDQLAVLDLHALLARHARARDLTAEMCEVLADMHEQVASGKTADVAMLTKPLPHRAPQPLRDNRLYRLVTDHLAYWDVLDYRREEIEAKYGPKPKRPSDDEIYGIVGLHFGISKRTAKSIFLRMRAVYKK